MAQLLVRNIEDSIVRKLKRRARALGHSAEEEHRRILREALANPPPGQLSLPLFLLSAQGSVLPEVELDLHRSRRIESRETGV